MPARGNLDAPKPRKRSAKRRSTSAPTLASGGKRQVRDIARQIRSAISLDDVLTGVVAEAGQALEADVPVVRLRENTAMATWARPGATAGAMDVREDLLHAMTGDDIVVVDDLSNDPLVWAAARHRLGAALGVPLSAADKVVGHLVLSTAARTHGQSATWPRWSPSRRTSPRPSSTRSSMTGNARWCSSCKSSTGPPTSPSPSWPGP